MMILLVDDGSSTTSGVSDSIPSATLRPCSSVEVVRSHKQFQAQISRYVHVSYAGAVSMLFIVVEVFDDFLEDDAAQVLKVADTALSFTEVVYVQVSD